MERKIRVQYIVLLMGFKEFMVECIWDLGNYVNIGLRAVNNQVLMRNLGLVCWLFLDICNQWRVKCFRFEFLIFVNSSIYFFSDLIFVKGYILCRFCYFLYCRVIFIWKGQFNIFFICREFFFVFQNVRKIFV